MLSAGVGIARGSSHELHCAVTSAKRETVTLRAAMHAPTMSRWLLILANTALGIASLVFAQGILDAVRHMPPVPAPREGQLVRTPAMSASLMPEAEEAAAYPEIALGNLFDPHRMEAASSAVEATTPWTGLVLQGVVVEGGRGRAFLEEPVTKTVAAFSVGDPVPGGLIEKISDDRVIIAGPGGLREVLLRDPSKPRRPVLAAAVPTPTTAPDTAPAPPPERIAALPVTQPSGVAPLLGRRIRGLND